MLSTKVVAIAITLTLFLFGIVDLGLAQESVNAQKAQELSLRNFCWNDTTKIEASICRTEAWELRWLKLLEQALQEEIVKATEQSLWFCHQSMQSRAPHTFGEPSGCGLGLLEAHMRSYGYKTEAHILDCQPAEEGCVQAVVHCDWTPAKRNSSPPLPPLPVFEPVVNIIPSPVSSTNNTKNETETETEIELK